MYFQLAVDVLDVAAYRFLADKEVIGDHLVALAFAEMGEHFRLPLVLSDVEGLAYKEIAEVMGCPVGTVMSRLHRARKMLQVSLRDQAVALGIVEPIEEKRAAANDPNEPVDLQTYRSKKNNHARRGGK